MSLSGVSRVRFLGASAIVKVSHSSSEAHFYTRIAPSLRMAVIPIPGLELALHEADTHWLVIEDIPTPLLTPQTDIWQTDPRIIRILAQLHVTTRAQPPKLMHTPPHGTPPSHSRGR